MTTVAPAAETVRQQLERVLASPGFARNERLSGFLRYIINQHLEGRGDELKESVIGVEVFGRRLDYNPKFDPIVRTEARRLRSRLIGYYEAAGQCDPVRIEVPKGGYAPAIRIVAQLSGSTPPFRSWLRPRYWAVLVVVAVAVVLGVAGMRRGPIGRRPSMTGSGAHDLFLRGRASEIRPAVRGVEDSIDLFEQAIAKDPSFAPAYAGLAAMEAARSAFDRFTLPERAQMIAKGWAAAENAIQLDANLPDAHDALAMMQARQGQWEPAERSFRRAIDLAPREPLWRDHFAMFLLLPVGRIDEAVGELRKAEELDPHSLQVHYALSLALRAAGRFDDAEFHCHRAAEDHQQLSECWAQTLMRQGETDEAIRILEEEWNGKFLMLGAEFLGVAYAQAGRRSDAARIAGIVPRPARKALIFAALGDKERTFECLDQVVAMGPTRLGRELASPEYAFLRSDPRVKVLRKKVGLPE
jgi:tetratricopeptide (TPR) repeat protein